MPDADESGTNVPSSDKIVSFSNEIVLSIYLLLNLKQECSFISTSESRQLLLCCILNNWKGLWQCEIFFVFGRFYILTADRKSFFAIGCFQLANSVVVVFVL